jgi:hypothetical protein
VSDEESPEHAASKPSRPEPGTMRYLAIVAAAAIGWISGRGSALVVPVGSFEGSAAPAVASSAREVEAPTSASGAATSLARGAVPGPSEVASGAAASALEADSSDELLARAERGELEALKRIELRARTERSVAAARALVLGHGELTRRDGVRLVEDLARDASLWRDRATLARLVELARDPSVAPDVLAALARTGHPTAADLLHELRLDFPKGSRLALYAEDLLFSPELRPNWSDALRIAIELYEVQGCPKALTLIDRASERADDRALGAFGRLGEREGCGPKRRDDCYPCLRDPEHERALIDAREAARSRVFERAWVLPKRY